MSNNLFFLSLADIFSVYPQIFNEIVSKKEKVTKIYLPSDFDWQDKMYYMLLEVQKTVNEALESGQNYEEVMRQKERPVFDASHVQRFSPASSPPNGVFYDQKKKCHQNIIKSKTKINVYWSLDDISKAAKLLKKPMEKITFSDEHEMRKVYSLIYDVFRYKAVLSNALNDVRFYKRHPRYVAEETRVWLMLYELQERSFQQRNAEETKREILIYKEAKVKDLADSLWQCRRKLAASISRMRIKYGALQLSNLLPIHLQNEKVALAATNPIITGWINPFLVRDREAAEKLFNEYGFVLVSSEEELTRACFKWDNICPLFLSCIPHNRNDFAKSHLVLGNLLIIQDRTFALGPAVMSRLLNYYDLTGDILQTHIDSPRSTAYLASLFFSVNKINFFYVYGAGTNLKQYRKYIEDLGINNIRLFAESFTSFPLESNRFRTVVGIFACPPNSFSAISDPIDLICSRGGDLGMLEILTDTSISDDGKYRVSLILEEQFNTLCMAMSRPQVQFILYQTHSIVVSENEDMANYVKNLINQAALQKHHNMYLERKRLEALEEAEAANIPSAAMTSSPRKRNTETVADNTTSDDDTEEVLLPEVDEFIAADIPDVCKNQDNCLFANDTGCFMSLIQRKQITRLNAKYLIQMAEKRGLFGKVGDSKSSRPRQIKTQESPVEKQASNPTSEEGNKKPRQNIEMLISRLGTHTSASKIRSNPKRASKHKFPIAFDYSNRICKRSRRFEAKKMYFKCQLRSSRHPFRPMRLRIPYPIYLVDIHM